MIGISKQEMVLDALKSEITSGILKKGVRLPSMRVLAERYGCSTIVIVKVMRELEKRGLVQTRERSGSVVSGSENTVLKRFALYTDILQRTMDHYYDDLLDTAGENHYLAMPVHAHGLKPLKTLIATAPNRIAIDLPVESYDYHELTVLLKDHDPIFVNRFEWNNQPLPERGILVDYIGIYAQTLNQLLEQGHKKIVFIGHKEQPLPFKRHYLEEAAKRNGLKFPSQEFQYCWSLDGELKRKRFTEIFLGKERPTAVFGASDILVFNMTNLLEAIDSRYRQMVRIGCHDEVWSRIPGYEFPTWHFDFCDIFKRAMLQQKAKLEWNHPTFIKRERTNIQY